MSPTAFDNDPLWNPGLVADFIADPRYGPDWSPLQDTEHFLQQLKVILYNVNSCIIFILPWIVFAGIFVARQRIRGCPTEKAVFSDNFPGLWWCPLTVLLYCGGYCTINLESRYIVPVIAPLLCLGVCSSFPELPFQPKLARKRFNRDGADLPGGFSLLSCSFRCRM